MENFITELVYDIKQMSLFQQVIFTFWGVCLIMFTASGLLIVVTMIKHFVSMLFVKLNFKQS